MKVTYIFQHQGKYLAALLPQMDVGELAGDASEAGSSAAEATVGVAKMLARATRARARYFMGVLFCGLSVFTR